MSAALLIAGAQATRAGGVVGTGTPDSLHAGGAQCTCSGSSGSAIGSTGTLAITDCTFSGNTGSRFGASGIANNGMLTFTNTIVATSTKRPNCTDSIELRSGDANQDRQITVNEILIAVNDALRGCN